MRIDEEFRGLIPPLSAEERAQLEANILRDGIREPLVVWAGEGILLDGHNRLAIAEAHGLPFETREMEFGNRAEAKVWVLRNQMGRRNLTPFQRAELALQLKPLIAEKAKAKQREAGGAVCQKSDKAVIDTKRELAAVADVSHDTIAKVETIMREGSEEVKAAARSGELSVNAAFNTIRREAKAAEQETRREANAEKVRELATPLDAQGLFQTIVIDPPWDWGDEGDVNQFGRAKPDYHTMPIEDIEALPVGRIADENCHLYLWATNRSLPKAFRLLEAWGFRYITLLTWHKPSLGMGNYFRGCTEQVLFGVKGSQPLRRHDVGTHFEAPRGERHSEKPEAFYQLVETCSHGPFIDLFGRKGREGWVVWGENGAESRA
jgi:N6-adenosine-specific RNA methylase IME4